MGGVKWDVSDVEYWNGHVITLAPDNRLALIYTPEGEIVSTQELPDVSTLGYSFESERDFVARGIVYTVADDTVLELCPLDL